ncbi:hypothetical protein [Aquimarina sp. 2201CG5-10]|uniref:hypothetical protein n=1 Tax=Aquimarina callyspongiae TaxID=3098150 RepID=UPI002AB4994F|nr:hypothetical protein [Aquimarina sp. 2201CG5-10]MDY8134029.1 hypothetical protein [Aquimarina sp. 2201CG5-10]
MSQIKVMLLSLFTSIFPTNTTKEKPQKNTDKIFITTTDPVSGRTLIIEEDIYSVWVYLLQSNKQGIEFEGFLCSVQDPKVLDINISEIVKNGGTPPITNAFSNAHSYVKNLKKKDITIKWLENQAQVKIKKEVYLIMDFISKTSYSKGVSKDGYYGKKL